MRSQGRGVWFRSKPRVWGFLPLAPEVRNTLEHHRCNFMEACTKEEVGGGCLPFYLRFVTTLPKTWGLIPELFPTPHGFPMLHLTVFYCVSKQRNSLNNSMQNQHWLLMWYQILSDLCSLQSPLLGQRQPLIALTSSSLLKWEVGSWPSWCTPHHPWSL